MIDERSNTIILLRKLSVCIGKKRFITKIRFSYVFRKIRLKN